MRMAFGVYAGTELKDVPLTYLQWLFGNAAISKAMRVEIEKILATHGGVASGDTMPFGKYAGFQVEEVPLSYLSWALANVDMPKELSTRMADILEESDYPKEGHLRPMHNGAFLKTKKERRRA